MLSERIYFIKEGFTDIDNFTTLDSDVKREIRNLSRELSRVHDYLPLCGARDEEQPSLSDPRFLMEIGSVVDSSDDILCDLTRNVYSTDLVAEIRNLADRIRKSFQQVPLQLNVTQSIVGNINNGDGQEIGSTTLFLGRNKPLEIKTDIRPKSYGHVPNHDIVGFKDEIETLLSHLKINEKTKAMGIVGMGGSGKTTLAKHVYNNTSHFSLKVWVCISQSWNMRDVLLEIWSQTIGGEPSKNMGDGEIMRKLYTFLESRSYLVVLDDIWDVAAWNDISPALPICRGSKVVVTTRKINVPKCIDLPFCLLKPNPLNDEESYELFCKRMYPDDENSQNKLQNKEIKLLVQRCQGLPLAITALAGVLRVDESPDKWTRIAETWTRRILNMKNSSTQGVVEEILALSYIDLPHYLKPCFLYLGIFHEDQIIEAEQLIQMWIAECLIRCPQNNEHPEESIAKDYLEEMIRRYIIQDVTRDVVGQVGSFRIHDLVHQMIVNTANKEGFLKDSHRIASSFSLAVETEKDSHVRSLICLHIFETKLSDVELRPLFKKFILRVFHLSLRYCVTNIVIPEEIGNLIHLRYLKLNGSEIILPRAFENLQNLWTLDLRGLKGISLKTNSFLKLKDLKHLYLPRRYYEVEGQRSEALNLDRLKNLKTLCKVIGGEWMLSEMPRLSTTLRKLEITLISSEEELNAVIRTPSILSNNLETLHLRCWNSIKLDGIKDLCKCKSLRNMRLMGGIGDRTTMFPPNLVKLGLHSSVMERIDVMGMIDKCCPNLKVLCLGSKAHVGDRLVCKENSFTKLEKFMYCGSDELKQWTIERGAMPNLKLLVLENCMKLELTPEGWEFVTKVSTVAYEECVSFGGSQFEKNLRSRRDDYLRSIKVQDFDKKEYYNGSFCIWDNPWSW